jgi:hypothetical protein
MYIAQYLDFFLPYFISLLLLFIFVITLSIFMLNNKGLREPYSFTYLYFLLLPQALIVQDGPLASLFRVS